MTRSGNQVSVLAPAPVAPSGTGRDNRHTCWSEQVVGLGGLEPPASSSSAKCREPLCGPPFPQVASDRRGRGYAFHRPDGMRSSIPPDACVTLPLPRPHMWLATPSYAREDATQTLRSTPHGLTSTRSPLASTGVVRLALQHRTGHGAGDAVQDLEELGYPGQSGAWAPQRVSPSSSRTPST
jgi:hypothetical protein